jgi:UDP-N-acetylmuramate dehydrogenase
MYKLIPNFSLRHNNSFGLDARVNYWLTISSADEWGLALEQYPHLAEEKKMIVGGGTNLLFLADYDGLVISADITGISILSEEDQEVLIEVGAGVEWDDFVAYCVNHGWYGVENLSFVPGKVGAVPVQNIGAYGIEAGSVVERVNGYRLDHKKLESYEQQACRFSYRSSIFKEELLNRFLVTSVVFRLQKMGELVSGYGDLKRTLLEIGAATLQNMRKAVIQIRESKLPNPKFLGNAGSFFKNPVMAEEVAAALEDLLPGLPVYQLADGFVKVGAGFLIEQAGWKGRKMGHAAVHERQALVLVNLGNATGYEILELSQAIQKDVQEKYGVVLEREVQVV